MLDGCAAALSGPSGAALAPADVAGALAAGAVLAAAVSAPGPAAGVLSTGGSLSEAEPLRDDEAEALRDDGAEALRDDDAEALRFVLEVAAFSCCAGLAAFADGASSPAGSGAPR